MIYLAAWLIFGFGFLIGSWEEWTENGTPWWGRLLVAVLWPLSAFLILPLFNRRKS